jgi:hypothetical protein
MPDPRVASPARLAYEARERGDRLFQIDLVVSAQQGFAQLGSAGTRTYRVGEGSIEEQGWHLEHVSTTFVQAGSSATKRIMANAGSTEVATHGHVIGLYVFRRAAEPTAPI